MAREGQLVQFSDLTAALESLSMKWRGYGVGGGNSQ